MLLLFVIIVIIYIIYIIIYISSFSLSPPLSLFVITEELLGGKFQKNTMTLVEGYAQ